MGTLADKLKSLGVELGAQNLPPPQPRKVAYGIEQVTPGRFQPTPFGQTYVVESVYGPDYRHGRAGLWVTASLRPMALWARETRLLQCQPDALAFIDVETTGLSGGTGVYAFLIGLGWYQNGHFHLAQLFMRDPVDEPAQLAALEELLRPCRAVVSFNGKSFDLPLLNTRYITNGQASPFTSAAHVDVLHLARRLWRDRLPSRALGYLETHILGAGRTEEDVPGWLIPSLYFDYLRSGDARPLKGIFYHNAMDILTLAALFSHTAYLLDNPLNGGIEHGVDLVAMGKLFEDLGEVEQAVQLYEHGLQRDLPEEAYTTAVQRLAAIHRRNGQMARAVTLWREAAARGHIYAHVELAKFYEHRRRDYAEAVQWTETALALVSAPDCPASTRRRWRPELKHRLARLRRKLEK